MLGRFSAGTRCGAAIPEFETALVTLTSMTAPAHKVTSTPPAPAAELGIPPAVSFVEVPPKDSSTPAGTFSAAIRRGVCAGHLPRLSRIPPVALVGRYPTPFPAVRPEIDTMTSRDVNHTGFRASSAGTNFRLTPCTLGFPAPGALIDAPSPPPHAASSRSLNHDEAPAPGDECLNRDLCGGSGHREG